MGNVKTVRKRRHVRASITWTALLVGLYGASAQAADAQATSAKDAPSSSDVPAGDIVVTAQRREERLQDVGLAVSAQTGAQLQSRGVVDAADLGKIIPSLRTNAYSSAATVYNVRGVSQNDYGDQQEPPIAVYQDDSYASSVVTAGFPIFDLARAEVLRGPQGTLFGRNATGGAVQFISAQPTPYFEGFVRATYASFDQTRFEAALSGPLSDTLSARIAGQASHGGDYSKAVVPGVQDQGGDRNFALRGILRWQPTSDISARLIVRYLKGDRERNGSVYSFVPSCPNAQFQGEFLPANESCAFFGTPPGASGTGYRNDAITPQRGGNPWRTAAGSPTYVNREIFGTQLRLDATVGPFDVVSITDYQHATKSYAEDTDASPVDYAYYLAAARLNQVSEEIRLSTRFGRNFLTFGGMAMSVRGRYAASFSLPPFGFLPDVRFSQNTRSFAFFGQYEHELTSSVKLIGGIRYWNDQRTLDYRGTEASTGVDLTINRREIVYLQNGIVQPVVGATFDAADARKSFQGVTGRVSIEYKPAADLLTYISYNRGSKSGGFTVSSATPSPSAVVDTLNATLYSPEKIDSFEAGVKATLAPRTTLNISGFYYKYNDYQAFQQIGLVQAIKNRDARGYGIEAEFSARPVNGLTLQLNGAYLNTKVQNVLLPDGVSIVERDLPQSPELSGSALVRYDHTVGAGMGFLQVDATWQSKSCFSVLCAPTDEEGGFGVANARIGYTLGKVSFQLFVNNLTNRDYRVFASDVAVVSGNAVSVYGRPRTVGGTLEFKFGN